jgi:RimJ/RimL family protein N-acetyltransferase
VSLSRIDRRNLTGELGIMIGEKGYRGQGFGAESLRMLVAYAFARMNLRRIKALVFADNGPAIKLYESCGFIREGTLREEAYKDGRFRDVHIFGLIRDGADRR